MTGDAVRGPRPVHVDSDDESAWARTYRVIALGRAENERWNRDYLQRNGLVSRVEELDRAGVGLRREPRADQESEDE